MTETDRDLEALLERQRAYARKRGTPGVAERRADLARLAPGAEVLAGARYVHNALDPDAPADEGRHLLLSAGVSAGIDLALYMLRALLGGDSVADATAQSMEFNPTSNFAIGLDPR